MSDATWSMMTRRRASSLAASFQDGRNTASSVDGAPRSMASASSVISSRSRACCAATPSRDIT